ncbi:MAG: DUF86 domain-containing protein [Candidatus Omnitrophica bacterium]|nr:DUF86 domain-containing protein [Candidatus Omnitrophota bacterium]
MLDRERALSKIDELDGYLGEIEEIMPLSLVEYKRTEKKRSCERLIQLSIECLMDVCRIFVSGLRLGLPNDATDVFDKLKDKGILTGEMNILLKEMRGFRNILVHEYASVDDELVYEVLAKRIEDIRKFKSEILRSLEKFK